MSAILKQDGQQLGGGKPAHTCIFEIAIVRPERHVEMQCKGQHVDVDRIAPFDTTPRLSDRPRTPPRWIDSQRQQIQRVLRERLLHTQFPRDAGHISLNLSGLKLVKDRLFSQPPRLGQAPEVIRERVEELLPDLEWKGRPSRGKKKADVRTPLRCPASSARCPPLRRSNPSRLVEPDAPSAGVDRRWLDTARRFRPSAAWSRHGAGPEAVETAPFCRATQEACELSLAAWRSEDSTRRSPRETDQLLVRDRQLKDRPRAKGIRTKVLGEGAIELVVVDIPKAVPGMGIVGIQEEDSTSSDPIRPSFHT
jgi:hypothetical protein